MSKDLYLYIHIPFCVQKCSYCDFTSFLADESTKESYISNLLQEIALWSNTLSSVNLCSIFIGGGTPSVLSPRLLEKLLRSLQPFLPDRKDHPHFEFTIECNPESTTLEKLHLFRSYNVNRISFGLQSTLDHELVFLGRPHRYSDFLHALENAEKAGFSNISSDLMFHLPGQTPKDFNRSLESVKNLPLKHISCYSLILEDHTPLQRQVDLGILPSLHEDQYLEMYHHAICTLEDLGYAQYEISNFAKPGYESRHNCAYWTRKEYLGLGLSAHSYLNHTRFSNPTSLKLYEGALQKNQFPTVEKEMISPKEALEETLFLGLRMKQGLIISQLENSFPELITPRVLNTLLSLKERKLLDISEQGHFSLTLPGIEISNSIFVELMESLDSVQ